jgi:hypothetical protein
VDNGALILFGHRAEDQHNILFEQFIEQGGDVRLVNHVTITLFDEAAAQNNGTDFGAICR